MSKRLGFKPRYIRSQQKYSLNTNNFSNGTFRRHNERFDLVNKTFPQKIYVCVDKETKKYAMAYDDKDKTNTSPVIIKPVDLSDKSQWMTSDAGAGILNFFYSLKNYIYVEVERNEELGGIIPIMRSDKWKNSYFKFGDNNEIIVDFNKGGKDSNGVQYCLAFRKTGIKYNGLKDVNTLASRWSNDHKAYDPSFVKSYDASGNKLNDAATNESFISKAFRTIWKPIHETFFIKERMSEETNEDPQGDDSDVPQADVDDVPQEEDDEVVEEAKKNTSGLPYLELVQLEDIDPDVWSYQWMFQEVWDVRTSTNLALENKQIEDLESIDQLALKNKQLAYDTLKTMYEEDKQIWDEEKAAYDSHFMTKFY